MEARGKAVPILKQMEGAGEKPIGGTSVNPVMKLKISAKVIENEAEVVEIPSSKTDIVPSASNLDKKVTQFIAPSSSISHALDPLGDKDKTKLTKSCSSPGVSGFV